MKKIDFTEYTLESNKFAADFSGFNFIVMTDLHSNSYGIDLHEVNRMIKTSRPDAILICGDMINGNSKDDPSDVLNYLITLAGHYPVFYALGNHEYRMKMYADSYGSKFYDIRDILTENGIVFLEDETVTLQKDDESLLLSGLEIDSVFYSKRHKTVMGSGLMDKHLGCAHKEYFNLLLAHNPEYFENYAHWGADLVLSGHNHGGIVRITKEKGLVSPRLSLLPKYDFGEFNHKNSTMILSRGLGAHTIKVRINNNPELIKLTIKGK